MATLVANYAARKVLGGQLEKYKHKNVAGDDDPFYTLVPDKHGKPRKVKKQIPAYIPEHDAHVLAKAKKRAYHLDMSLFTLFGIRFGWSSIIGLIPWLGDAIDLYFAYALVQMCQQVSSDPFSSHDPKNTSTTMHPPSRQHHHNTSTPTATGLPASLTSKMYTNVAIDFALGLVPFLGDIADASFKCNTKNVALLEKYLVEKYAPRSMSAGDKARSGLEVFPEDAGMVPGLESVGQSQGQGQGYAQYGSVNVSGVQGQGQGQRRQEEGEVGRNQNGGSRKWFGFGGKQGKKSDVERGQGGQENGTIPVTR